MACGLPDMALFINAPFLLMHLLYLFGSDFCYVLRLLLEMGKSRKVRHSFVISIDVGTLYLIHLCTVYVAEMGKAQEEGRQW